MKFIKHNNSWIWGKSTIIITNDGYGTITVQVYDDEPDRAYIISLSVETSKRRCGYATKLIKEAEKVAENYGVKTISLMCDKNSWIYNWYLSLGYEFCGVNLDYKDTMMILSKDIKKRDFK